MSRLNLGCGRASLPGWVNLDLVTGPAVDVVADLNACRSQPLPFADDIFDEIRGSHVIEHISDTLPMMQELHRVAKAEAIATFRTPYGSSDDAHEDPTHMRCYFLSSWGYFSQPFYWRADYGYRGDWQPQRITLIVSKAQFAGQPPEKTLQQIHHRRNIVLEMIAELRCIKPIREPNRELIVPPEIVVQMV